jgi:hypothetical protein
VQRVCGAKFFEEAGIIPRSDGIPAKKQAYRLPLQLRTSRYTMIDRDKLETLLVRRFPKATRDQVAAAANAIMGMDDEWEEVGTDQEFGYHYATRGTDICTLAREAEAGTEFRLLRRRAS